MQQRVTEQICKLNVETKSCYVVKKLLVAHEQRTIFTNGIFGCEKHSVRYFVAIGITLNTRYIHEYISASTIHFNS